MSPKKERVLTPEQQARSEKARAAHARRKAEQEAAAKPAEPAVEATSSAPANEVSLTVPVAEVGGEAQAFRTLAQQPPPVADEPEISPEDARRLAPPAPVVDEDEAGHVHHVHFLADGMTVAGKMRYVGDELRVVKGTPEYDYVHGPNGECLLAMSEDDQWDKWGMVKFAPGPWRGRGYDLQARLESGETLTAEEQAVLDKINRERGLVSPGARR